MRKPESQILNSPQGVVRPVVGVALRGDDDGLSGSKPRHCRKCCFREVNEVYLLRGVARVCAQRHPSLPG